MKILVVGTGAREHAICQAAIQDGLTALLALGAAGLLVRFRFNPTWLILAGGLVGLLRAALAA